MESSFFVSLLNSASFWVAVSFVLFILIARKPVLGLLFSTLDDRSVNIKSQLDEALKLKEEAQSVLSSYKARLEEIQSESEKMIKQAEDEAASLIKQANLTVEESTNRRINLALDKLKASEDSLIHDIKNKSIDSAAKAIESLLRSELNNEINKNLIDQAIVKIQETSDVN